ncbi:unnamed protein product [Pleuronectes platessa]|uniref:Uncharacterized protein n=1 Tax=Pleuronectes platessa TaxID=8262 RepID=A0A9N7YA71_PLEPL|nr:unnamed protein product [Pleuronectes platessa]
MGSMPVQQPDGFRSTRLWWWNWDVCILTRSVTAPGLAPVGAVVTGGRSPDQQLASRCLTSDLSLSPPSPTSSGHVRLKSALPPTDETKITPLISTLTAAASEFKPQLERQESRCSLIFDCCTFTWHTGQLTVSEEEEEEDEVALREDVLEDEEEAVAVAVTVLCCTAGALVFTDSLDAADSVPNVFWK